MWLTLFADAREDPLRSPEVIWGVAGLIVALLVGAAVISAVDKWRKRAVAGPTGADATEALSVYRQMYESGEITEEEYAKLRTQVAEKVKKPAPAPKPAAPPTGTRPASPAIGPSGGSYFADPSPSPLPAPPPDPKDPPPAA